jgi:hypothetical protein
MAGWGSCRGREGLLFPRAKREGRDGYAWQHEESLPARMSKTMKSGSSWLLFNSSASVLVHSRDYTFVDSLWLHPMGDLKPAVMVTAGQSTNMAWSLWDELWHAEQGFTDTGC